MLKSPIYFTHIFRAYNLRWWRVLTKILTALLLTTLNTTTTTKFTLHKNL